MPKDDVMLCSGKVVAALANTQFKVILDNGFELLCHISGRIRKNFIKVIPGDRVEVEVSAYDINKGRIVKRTR